MTTEQKEQIVIADGLIVVPQSTVPQIFSSEDNIRHIVKMIKDEVSKHVPDLTTAKSRKEISGMSAKVSKSKVILDNLGKDLVAEWKDKAKTVDSARRIARDDLDSLRDEVQKPLTDWEDEQERIALVDLEKLQKEQARAEAEQKFNDDFGAALVENENITLRRVVAEHEAEKKRVQDIEDKRIADELEKNNRLEREAQIRKEESERVEKESADKLRVQREEYDRNIREAQEEADRKFREEIERVEAEAFEAAERIRKNKIADDKRAARKGHQAKVNNDAVAAIVLVMSELHPGNVTEAESVAKDIVVAIAKGLVPAVTINY